MNNREGLKYLIFVESEGTYSERQGETCAYIRFNCPPFETLEEAQRAIREIWWKTRSGWIRKPDGNRWHTTRSSSTTPLWNSWSRTQSDVHFAWYSGQKIVYFSRLLSFAPDGNMHIPKGESPKGKTKTRRNSP